MGDDQFANGIFDQGLRAHGTDHLLAPTIALHSIGYADGLMRRAGSGKYSLMRSGVNYPIMGNVCMDVTMIHLGTEATLKEGDELIIFGPNHPVEALAACCETISYEILSRIAPRVKRSYIYE